MSIKVAIRHKTSYTYDRPVSLSPHVFRLKPAAHCRTPILSYSLKVTPEKHFINWQQDPFGNFTSRVVFPDKTTQLAFEVEVLAEIIVINPFDFFIEDYAEHFPFAYDAQLKKELLPYFEVIDNGPLLQQLLNEFRPKLKKLRTIDMLVMLNQGIQQRVAYTIRMEPGVQTSDETLTLKLGSCRDSGWLLVQLFRQLGLAARFVSGYLVQLKSDQKALDGPSGTEKDFTDLHAWCEVYIPGAGWIGLDPTSGLFAGEGHIPLCCTPDPVSAAPVTGMSDVCEVIDFNFSNEVFRIHEDPRVTQPYTEEQWDTILALGNKIDEDLLEGDARLTMGGEPTFVSVDDMEAKEWNTTADGPQKRALASKLIKRLKEQFGPGGLIHKGQGKWYPGEPLPRWNYTAIWRHDHYPIWQNDRLLDLEDGKSNYTIADVRNLGSLLTKFLGVPSEHLQPALEDAFYFLWEESRVPVNIDPYKADLNDPLERQRLAQLLNNGLDTPVGYVLPVEWNYWNNRWLSCRWEFRNDRLMLMPGNSPIGLRLPLKSLSFTSSSRMPREVERSPFERETTLERTHEKVQRRYLQPIPPPELPREYYTQYKIEQAEPDKTDPHWKKPEEKPKEPESTFDIYTIKTALCLELRDGKICVFMPPLQYADHYLDMLASIEAAAAQLNVRVVIEGYEPPRDNRLAKLGVSPDPGVVEVNIHPAKTWKELVNNYDILFEQARLSRLSSEKFMLDGKHTGTGGGNHITIGGITPSDSPLLRRPDLLKSLVTYWQNHPGLSYMFASQFIGPTSQAPRVDEGRPEMLYELEIAFKQVPQGQFIPFWMVDRIFRNLLIDITGNTHRAEFCIDKLYSPDSSTGRLGILEFRAFDMPPNKQMCIVQLLLLRAIVSRCWNDPYQSKLVRWGSMLYDKFMLPHYVYEDMKEVCEDLQRAGYPFQIAWLDTFYEFRFPLCGKIDVLDMELQLRQGIEPWHVLGEEAASGGTARFVDSSVERIEVKMINFNAERYLVTCHGIPVPLRETTTKGTWVAGVRYRAWSPPSALHPTIGKDVPLVFDVFDTWNNRSVGGCVYHVSHPGGRAYDTFPVNAYEAEGRRISRFWNEGHTQGSYTPTNPYAGVTRYLEKNTIPRKFDPPSVVINPEYPNTLDLRQY
ncbi:transglutaminase family protein [Chryseolinea sp. T2]|uniref:transglutaminase family protein n=1 Tax=Chryseolinea sp. T2 TaxID=3129255 RepID=UPI00307796DD